ncbi:hypothetical protein Tco_0728379 [Tanacetum coccineum]|uniref:Uncharacterized protein n=1 Tax=Tanacetum coccineum TaxID=301880 RepID=A0ABQ4YP15_9ASTR
MKVEFEKLVKQLDTYVPMNFEATKESLKRFGEEIQTKIANESKVLWMMQCTQQQRRGLKKTKDDKLTKKLKKEKTDSEERIPYINKIRMKLKISDEANEKENSIFYFRVHCLNLESVDVYMLIEIKYPLSAEVCKDMLDKKLQGGKPDEDWL